MLDLLAEKTDYAVVWPPSFSSIDKTSFFFSFLGGEYPLTSKTCSAPRHGAIPTLLDSPPSSDSNVQMKVGKQTKDCRILVFHAIALFNESDSAGESIFQMNVDLHMSVISTNIRRDTVSKWTHQLQKEADNLEKSLSCYQLCMFSRGCYPRSSRGESKLIKKVPIMERLPWRFDIVEHQ